MATTNYSVSKSTAAASLNASDLPGDIVNKILSKLGSTVKVVQFDSNLPLTNPTGAAVNGKDLVMIDPNGPVDLSSISKANIQGVDAFIFTTNENVDFTLSGSNTFTFKGVVATNAGDDIISLNSRVGVTVSSGDGNDNVKTGSGHDYVNLGAGDDTVNTGAGNDTISAEAGNDSINSGAGNDAVSAGAGNDAIITGAGNDIVWAEAGNDSVNTGSGNDTVSAGAGDDLIFAGVGNDIVTTGPGNDSVYAGSGNDTVYLGSGDSLVNTGVGNDIVKLISGYSGTLAQLNGSGGDIDKLDLSLVSIDTVSRFGPQLTITLDDGSVVKAINFEKFVYDSNGIDTEGGIVIVGIDQFDAHS
ncbi:calcium-binding protein [Nitrosomonas ureae]|uniref:Hemolysin-type calcium-binding repeat-containing protein n=1 Tax=Nitrosomonas ureae TaxID=44577 RepID=A0A1H5UHI5_9PROT|nr:calcium-binding protein [Nitrosomonas ureae]SEF74513.1 Hemolysin-type calcium-binding repeat-containing protein [Nitrosomonas ureae]